MNLNRRTFLKKSTAASLAFAAIPILGATNSTRKYRTALIGTGWWGMNILNEAMASGECTVVGMCDVDQGHIDDATAKVEELSGDTPRKYKDYRDLLEEENPEIVIIGTPDHWHALQTIDSVRAGAHVYVEKPIGHTIHEGTAMVKAARDTGKQVQVGTHRRVSPHNVSGIDFLKSGRAGNIGMVRAFVHYGGGAENPQANAEAPEGLDWDMWCGPAPLRPFNSKIHPRGFRGFLNYANGQLGDWGIHWMDQILMWTEEKYPKRVFSTGGRHIRGEPVYNEDAQTTDAPDTQVASFEFESFTAVWEHRQYAANEAEQANIGCYFYGTEGTFHMGWLDGWTFYPRNRSQQTIHEEPTLHQPDQQNIKELWADFMTSIKTGEKPVCDIEVGHRSTNMSLLGMLSMKLGRSVEWDGENDMIVGDAEASKLLSREYRGEWEYPEV
ncbi:MAG: Gfo/Idh/MocA family oxidoreductase [Opitutales bacterium]